jgi:hypothetical protein
MRMSNVHERRIAAPTARVGTLLDTLASSDDRFWPHENWPAIRLDRPLQVGATGGHGTGPYTVTSYAPGKHIRFEFGGERDGYHEFTLEEAGDNTSLLRHTLKAKLTVRSAYRWYVHIRPLHNALIEDLLDKVEGQLSRHEGPQRWSVRVIRLRRERGMTSIKNKYLPRQTPKPIERTFQRPLRALWPAAHVVGPLEQGVAHYAPKAYRVPCSPSLKRFCSNVSSRCTGPKSNEANSPRSLQSIPAPAM